MLSNRIYNLNEINDIKNEIERVRLLLNHQVGSNYKRCLDPEIIELSQQLDKLLNDYMRLSV